MDVAMPLDEYERTKPWEPRSGPALALSRQDREELLVEWGATFYDIIEAIRANIKAKNQRRRTVHAIGTYDRWEEVMENASRKIKRTLTLKKPKKIEDSTPKPISRYRGDLSSNQSSVRSLNSISQMMMIMIPDAVEFPDGADAVADGIRSIIPPKSESPREENDKTAAIAQQSEMSSAVQPQSEVAPKPPQRRHTPPSYQMENFSVASSTTLDDLSSFGCSSRKAAAYAATSSHSNIKEVVIEMDAAVGVQSARVDDDDDDTTLPSIYGLMDRYCEEETTLPFIVGSEKRRPSTAEDEGSADTFDANYNSTAAFVLMQNNHDNASSCSTLEVDEDDDDDDDDAFMILEGLSIASRTSGFTSEYQSSHSIVSNGDGNFENLKRDSSFWELCPGQQDSPAIQRKAAPVIISEDMNYGFNANMYGGQQPQPTYDRAAVTGRTALPTTYNVVDGRYWENGFTMQPPPNSSSLIMKWE